MGSALEARDGVVWMHVRVQPKASRNQLRVAPDGRIRIWLTSPPVDGAANKALLAYLVKTLGLPRGAVQLSKGLKSRDKMLVVSGVGLETLQSRLNEMSEI
jgi:hypothetical protein